MRLSVCAMTTMTLTPPLVILAAVKATKERQVTL